MRLAEGCRFSATHLLLCLVCPQSIVTFFTWPPPKPFPPFPQHMFEQWVGWEYNDTEEIRKVNYLFLSPRATQTFATDP